jgi:hypothetical protein
MSPTDCAILCLKEHKMSVNNLKSDYKPFIGSVIQVPEVDEKTLTQEAQACFGSVTDGCTKKSKIAWLFDHSSIALFDFYQPDGSRFEDVVKCLASTIHEQIASVYPALVDADGSVLRMSLAYATSVDEQLSIDRQSLQTLETCKA